MRNLIRVAVAALLSLHACVALAQAVGRVIAASGDVTLVRANAPQAATVGTALQQGDLIRTGAQANAQLWFSDASVVALRHSTDFRVAQYTYRNDQATDRAVYDLLRGGLRTVAGVIGSVERTNYRIVTPHANIGRRGTQFALVACQDDCVEGSGSAANGTYGGIFEGRIGVVNNSGEVQFGTGEFFFVADLNTIPKPLVGPPSFLADRLTGLGRGTARASSETTVAASSAAPVSAATTEPPPAPPVTAFSTTTNVTASGAPAVVGVTPTPPNPGPAPQLAFSGAWSSGGPGTPFTLDPGGGVGFAPLTLTVSGSGSTQILTRFAVTAADSRAAVFEFPGRTFIPSDFAATIGPGGADMIGFEPIGNVHWGRWVDPTHTDSRQPVAERPLTGTHYVYGEPTLEPVIGAKTGTLTYSDAGGTTPIDNNGNRASAFSFGPITVNFTNRTGSMSSASVTGGGSNYSFSNTPLQFYMRPGQGVVLAGDAPSSGSCTGSCGGAPGPARIQIQSIFFGPTGNVLGSSIHLGRSNQIFSAVRVFKCPTCP
jgi:hypothetical protein